MKVTRLQAIAQNRTLHAQLAASGHESRKVRAARLASMTKTIEALETENTALKASIALLQANIQALKKQVPEA